MTKNQADQTAGLKKVNDREEQGRRPVRVIAVTSGKGGVGKTNIVASLALSMARLGQRVVVMDADLSLANMDILLGLSPEYHLGHVFSGERRLAEVLVNGPGGIKILPASNDNQGLSLLTEGQKATLLEEMDSLEDSLDVLLIDTSAGIGYNVIYFNLAAHDRVVVVTPEPTSITDAYALIKFLFTQHREKNFHILVNETRSEGEGKEVFAKLASVADRFLGGPSLYYLGHIPYDTNIPKAVRRQKAFLEAFPDTPASKGIIRVAEQLLKDETRGGLEGNIRFFWKRLFAFQGSVG